ncbi:hypothetical protein PTKIN_Ptkin18bG0140500 [Pterospermum kingtungense]
MATKIKGIYKGFKYISQIFVMKEREMEIGYPTDVKHVAHIGWDGPSGTAPSWMNEFKPGSDFSAASVDNPRDSNPTPLSTWSSQDFEQSMGNQPATEMVRNLSSNDQPNIHKKQRRKKKSTSSPKSSSRSSRTSKTKAAYAQLGSSSADLEM